MSKIKNHNKIKKEWIKPELQNLSIAKTLSGTPFSTGEDAYNRTLDPSYTP